MTEIFLVITLIFMGKSRGRPPKPEGETLPEVLQIRLTPEDKARWTLAAKHSGQSLSEWMRERLNALADTEIEIAEGQLRSGR